MSASASTPVDTSAAEPAVPSWGDVLARTPAFVAVFLGPDHRLAYASPSVSALLGLAPAQAQGRALETLKPLASPRLRELLDQVLASGTTFEGREVLADGRIFRLTIVPMQNDGQPPYGVVAFALEVTDEVLAKEQAEELERRYRFALDALPVLAWTRDDEGIEFVNRRWEEYTGISAASPRTLAWTDAIHPEDRAGVLAASAEDADAWETEARYLRHDGTYRWHLVRSVALRGPDGRITRRLATATDIEDQKRTEARQRYLAEAATRLASSLDRDATAHAIVDVAVPAFADWAVVHLVGEDGTLGVAAGAHRDPTKLEAANEVWARWPTRPDEKFGPAAVVRTQRSEWAAEITPEMLASAATSPEHRARLERVGFLSYLTVPLVARGTSLGAITFLQADSQRRFTAEDVATAEELARRAALALDNAARYDAERSGARTVQRLQAVTARLVQAQGARDVARVVCHDARAAVGASTAIMWSLEADDTLRVLAFEGMPQEYVDAGWSTVPASTFPPLRSANGEPSWIENEAAYSAVDPELARRAKASGRPTALAAVPLVVDGRRVGLAVFGFPGEHPFTPDEKAFIEAVCGHVGQALDRARSLDAERRSNERLRLLASIGELLTSSLDYRSTFARLTELVVPVFAVWCSIDLVEDGRAVRLAVQVADPEKAARARAFELRAPVWSEHGETLARLAHRQSRLVPRVTKELVAADAKDEAYRDLILSLGIGSSIQTPLFLEDRVAGVITFMAHEAAVPYDQADVSLADEIGRRASLALANATLFRREQEARKQLARMQDLTSALAAAATPLDVARIATEAACSAFGYDTATLYRPEEKKLVLAAEHGLSAEDAARLLTCPAGSPVEVVARTGEPIWLESHEAITKGYPSANAGERYEAGAIVPLKGGGRVLAVMALALRRARLFPPAERAFVHTFADQCAQALDRAALLERELRASERLAVLARAGEAFSHASDYEATLENVVRVAVPALGDFAFFDVVEGETVRRLPFAYADPETQGLLEKTTWQRSERTDVNLCALSTGEAGIHPHIDEAWMRDVATSPGHLALLQALRLCSLVTVPLRARGRVLGSLTFCHGRSGRSHDASDLSLAQELAARASTAIEQARLYEDVKESARRAEEASRIKDDFLATVSHELRTPLNAIVGWSALLCGERANDPAALRKGLDVIQRNARAQARIIDDVLDVSRIVSGKLKVDVRPVDLASVVREAADVVRPSADAKGVSLELSTDGQLGRERVLFGDAERLRQVAWNLLSNAVKFSDEGGRVHARVAMADGRAELVVTDTGRGIAREFLPHVFERFRQADSSSTRAYGGLGLGLAIARHIVELHGGTIRAESEGTGKGATFRVDLPTRREGDVAAPASSGKLPDARGPALDGVRLLVVDDDPDARELMATLLETTGAEALTAGSADEAIARIEEARPDLVLSDIAMPGEDGYALVARIRGLAGARDVRVVALTAYARPEDRARMLDAGFDAHLAKPIDPTELLEVVAGLVRRPVTTPRRPPRS